MTYELARELKDAGFPQKENPTYVWSDNSNSRSTFDCYVPTLDELAFECGDELSALKRTDDGFWTTIRRSTDGGLFVDFSTYQTPEEALSRLWLSIQRQRVNDRSRTQTTERLSSN